MVVVHATSSSEGPGFDPVGVFFVDHFSHEMNAIKH